MEEGVFGENSILPPTNHEQIDLTLKLSPCGQDVEEKCEKGLMRFGDLQIMRRVRTGKRLLLEKQRRAAEAAAAEAHKSKFDTLAISSWQQGGASSNIQMPHSPTSSDTKLESPAKKLKHARESLS